VTSTSTSTTTATLSQLPAAWRADAATLRSWGAAENATTLERAADELEAALHRGADETLSLPEAARESGYSADHLGRLIREGKLPNAGRPNAPRIRRGDLPRKTKARRDGRRETLGVYSPVQIARSVVTSLKEHDHD
jgi:hypothetical protein